MKNMSLLQFFNLSDVSMNHFSKVVTRGISVRVGHDFIDTRCTNRKILHTYSMNDCLDYLVQWTHLDVPLSNNLFLQSDLQLSLIETPQLAAWLSRVNVT